MHAGNISKGCLKIPVLFFGQCGAAVRAAAVA